MLSLVNCRHLKSYLEKLEVFKGQSGMRKTASLKAKKQHGNSQSVSSKLYHPNLYGLFFFLSDVTGFIFVCF